jgi:hypothetical protein
MLSTQSLGGMIALMTSTTFGGMVSSLGKGDYDFV